MKTLSNLPDINFVDIDAATIEAEIINEYETITGRTLQRGDPVRLFLLTITNIIILLLNRLNKTGKQNLLRYAEGDNLDHLGALLGVERIEASAAKVSFASRCCSMRFLLSARARSMMCRSSLYCSFASSSAGMNSAGERKPY